MPTLDYTIVDVFAERALEGNPLCVVHNAHGLSDAQMQALASETNLSETTFIFPSDDPAQDVRDGVRVRIFTTQEELPFAGHPTLGTASWLHLHHPALRAAPEITLRLKGGPIRVTFPEAFSEAGVQGTMRQPDPTFGAEHDRAEVAAILGLNEADLLEGFVPQSVSTGNFFCIVALRDVATLKRLAIPQQQATAWLRERKTRWFYCIAPQDPTANIWRARMQWESGEDPATGSAAGPCIAWLVHNNLVPPDTDATLQQGVEIHRPSRLTARASRDGNRIHTIDISGRTIPVAAGRYFLPA